MDSSKSWQSDEGASELIDNKKWYVVEYKKVNAKY